MRRISKCAGIALISALIAACVPRFSTPDVRLAAVRLGGLGLNGGTVRASLFVYNPNSYALGGTALSYDLALGDPASADWVPFADGSLESTFHVPAEDSARVEIPVNFTYAGLGSALRAALRTGEVSYRLTGTVQVSEPVRRRVPYTRTGTVRVAGEQ
ncbi:MAG: LEA type 2 family protein [Gemmatimonadetes bacterium]|nr:LEA type 2 family protein [Gemmatimonadota bacterium]